MIHGQAVNRTTTGNVSAAACRMTGFYVNSTSSGTLVFRDGGASGTVLDGTITPAVGWHFFPVATSGILHVTVGATIDVTFFIQPT